MNSSAGSLRAKSSACVAVSSPVTQKFIGVIGSRSLPLEWADRVGTVTEDLLGRGCQIASGGAVGTDEFVLSHLVHIGESARGTLYSPWSTYDQKAIHRISLPYSKRVAQHPYREYQI